MNKRLIIGIGVVVLLLVGAASYASYQKSQTTKKADAASLAAERQFMEQMTSHHADAIQMAQMAQEKAQTKTVKTIASGIITAQNKETTEMKTWYKQWFGKDMPEMAAMPGMMMDDGMDMGKLSSATDFDLEFVSQMIPHHQKAVEMAKAILPKAKHQEIKTLANNIISAQNSEIEQMQSLKTGFMQYPAGSTGRHLIDCGDDTPGC